MSLNKDDESPPPYSTYSLSSTSPSSSHSHTILGQLSTTRTRHIHSVISDHILPIVHQRIAYGIAQTTIALLPSDIPLPALDEKSDFSSDHDDNSKPVQVIGFASDTEPHVVRLTGQMNRTEFWKSQAVIHELEAMLGESLDPKPTTTSTSSGGDTRETERENNGGVVGNAGGAENSLRQSRRKLLARVMPSTGPEQRSPSNNPEVGVRQVHTAGTVAIRARLEEICLRTVSDFGLYDTMSKQCVVVQVDARC